MANTNKCLEALKEFQKQYPDITSADLQTFILGFKAGEDSIDLEALIEWYKNTSFNCEGNSNSDCVKEYLK